MLVGDSNRSRWWMVGGLSLLVPLIAFALWAVFELEQSVRDHRHSMAVQARLAELNGAIKDWVILKQEVIETKNSNLVPSLIEDGRRISAAVVPLAGMVEKSPEQLARLTELRQIWDRIISTNVDLDRHRLRRIDQLISQLDAHELASKNVLEPKILSVIEKITQAMALLGALAILLIGYSFWTMAIETQRRRDLMKQLEDSREAALATAQLKSQFLAIVSHEVRTPLNGIIGISDVLKRTSLDSEQRRLVGVMHSAGLALLKIVNDILDFSKIEGGRIQLESVDFSLQRLLEQVRDALNPKAVEKGIELQLELSENLPPFVRGDPERLMQVLFNLVGNAIKFTKQGSVKLRVESSGAAPGSGRIQFFVEDTGIGIDRESQKLLFQPFVQLQKVGTMGESGSGLGLSIARQLVRLMGGEISLRSDTGVGSVFSFELQMPLAQSASVNVGLVPPEMSTIEASAQIFAKENAPRILVVEDNSTNQMLTQAMLIRLGASVTLASDGQEALALAREGAFDLILMDCQMPVMDGFAATRTLRGRGVTAPILALTADAGDEIDQACRDAGMNALLPKPVTIQSLALALRRFLRGREVWVDDRVLSDLKAKIGEGGFQRVVSSFIESLNDFRSTATAGREKGDLNTLRQLGHRFRASAKTVGAVGFAQICEDLENSEDIDSAVRFLGPLLSATHDLQSHLKQIAQS